jgi:hypothetical protein
MSLPWYRPRHRNVLRRAVAYWSPSQYDSAIDSLVDLSGNGLHMRLGSAVGADTNDPLRLTYRGRKEVYFPGVVGNGIVGQARTIDATPTSERIEVASIDLRALVGSNDFILSGNASTRQQLAVASDGRLRFRRYDISAAAFSEVASSIVAPADALAAAALWDGATSVTFYYANTEDLASAEWIQLGDVRTITAITSNGTEWNAVLGNTSHLLSATTTIGRISQARWFRGGVLLDNFDAAKLTEPYASYVDGVTNTTWTLNRSATGRKLAVVDRDMLLLGTDDFMEAADHPLLRGNVINFSWLSLQRAYGAPYGSSVGFERHLTKKSVTATTSAGWNIESNGTTRAMRPDVADGTTRYQATAAAYSEGVPFLSGGVLSGARLYPINPNSSLGTSVAVAGPIESTDTLRFGSTTPTGGAYFHGEFFAAAIFREALTETDLRRLAAELGVAS